MILGLGLGTNLTRSASAAIPADLSWLSTSGLSVTGSSVDSWAPTTGSVTLSQTSTARPTRTSSVFGSSYGVTFDGSNDYLTISSRTVTSPVGSIGIVFKTGTSVTGPMVLVSQANVATTTDHWKLGIASDGRLFFEYSDSVGGVITIKGSTVLETSTVYYAFISHDGTDTYLELNGTEENPLVNSTPSVTVQHWIGEVEGATQSFSFGAIFNGGGASQFFNGSIGGVWIWNSDITA